MDTLTITLGEAGGPPATPQELEERLKVLEDKVKRDAREIVEILRVDFPLFVAREAKERFTRWEGADALPDAKLKAFKADLAATGKKAVDEVVPALEEWAIWLEPRGAVPPSADRKDLKGNAEVSARLQKIGGYVKELLERHGFAVRDEEFRDAYRIPTRFIPPRGYAIGHVESYWRDVEEYQQIHAALAALKERDQRAKRAERFDAL
jgi:hypothetical protein